MTLIELFVLVVGFVLVTIGTGLIVWGYNLPKELILLMAVFYVFVEAHIRWLRRMMKSSNSKLER